MTHRDRNENREHKARKDPKKLARRTKIHKPKAEPTFTVTEVYDGLAEYIDSLTDWEDEGGNL